MAAGSSGYDAFISYSHALDGALAPALQTGLERFAKPWYRPRALRIFRDITNLAANPGLWTSIEQNLEASDWLVLMASPAAAKSEWVDREVAWWLEYKSPQRLLVVLTEGEFAWADDAGQGNGTTAALPSALRNAFIEEPRWVDLRGLHDVDRVAQSNLRLQACVADVAAAVRGVAKDELVGEHIRQHRLIIRLVWGVAIVLAALLIAAVVQWNRAVAAQHTAIARGMVAQADQIRDRDPRGALQFGIAANQLDPSPQTQASLQQTLTSTTHFRTLRSHTRGVNGVAFTPDGRTLATTSDDQTVILWDLTDQDRPRQLGPPLTGHKYQVHGVAYALDGRTLATVSSDGTARLWDVSDRDRPRPLGLPLTGHTGAVYGVAFAPDGRTLATTSADWTVRLWDVSIRDRPRPLGLPLTGHKSWVGGVAFAPDGRILATASGDTTVILWDLTDRDRPHQLGPPLTGHTNGVKGVAFAPDGRTLATAGEDQTVRLWDVSDRDRPHQLGQPLTGRAVAYALDGRTLATASFDGTARLWDVSDRDRPHHQLGQSLTGHLGWVFGVAFSPDGRTLATTSGDTTVILWDVSNRDRPHQLGRPLTGHTHTVWAVAFSPDGRTLATVSSDKTVRLWDVSDRDRPHQLGQPLTGHTEAVAGVAYAPDGRTLATTGGDGIRLWDLSDRNRPHQLGRPLIGHTDGVNGVAFAPDGRTLATAGGDHTVILWDLPPLDRFSGGEVREACLRAGGPLDRATWDQYAPGVSYQNTCADP